MLGVKLGLAFLYLTVLFVNVDFTDARAFQDIRSDTIETRFGDEEPKDPGWMRQKLINFGEIASKVGGKLGSAGMKVTGYIESLCKMLKAIVPIVATVCHVKQFQFCASSDASLDLTNAIQAKDINLNIPD
ncbi:PREDICTED: uncharacterized protein LOC108565514 isoform X2 [Nicrophorus vespilloides]|uniref:Uncharacterized protein LOC108565514 isoform X2 n=1 Tax=Nicrophorus vespilloides TaxID=110193 RepID=A0ABM1N111_NICVS|nr:PREDICTED: uncharacterized protein LOC108565514 isoform X2 [Nicrophorus vespilloides]